MGLTPVELDSPEQIRLRARKLEGTLNSVSAKSSTIRTTWSSLTTSYSAPEADIVHNAMNKPDDWARTLKGHAKTMREALVTYADRLDELKIVRDQLVKDIAAHEGAVKEADSKKPTAKSNASPNLPGSNTGPGGTVSNVTLVEGGVTPELVEKANELATRVEQFQTDLEDAQRTCGNKLNATWGGPQFVQSDKTSVNNPYAWGTSMDAKRDQTRTGKEAWGSPDAWKLANKNGQAAGLLLRQGAWKSLVDGWNDFKDLVGLGGDPGATEHKRSGLAKIAVDFSAFSILSTPLGIGLMSYDKNARQRYMESSATVGAVLKGLVSYDTWSADPIGTYGGFVPDMVTTAVSMGSGGAAKLSVKALSMVSPGAAVKAARVLRVLRQVDPGFVDDIKRTVKVSHGSTDVRRLETVTGTLPHVKADGSGITPTHPNTGPGPIERSMSGADGGHPGKADVGGGSQPRTNADSAQVPERHGSGPDGPAKPTTPGDVEPRRAAPEAQGADQPSGSPARRAEDTHTSQGQSGSGETAHHAPGASTDARPDAHPGRLPGDADPHSRVPDGSSPSGRPANPMDGSQGGRNTYDPSPDAPGDGRSGSGRSDNSPQFDENGKPVPEDRGDGRKHQVGDPDGTYRDSRGHLQHNDGGYAKDPYADIDKELDYPHKKLPSEAYEWNNPSSGDILEADKAAQADLAIEASRRADQVESTFGEMREKYGIDPNAEKYAQLTPEKKYEALSRDMSKRVPGLKGADADRAQELVETLDNAKQAAKADRNSKEWLGERAAFNRNNDMGRETIVGRPSNSPRDFESTGNGKLDQVAIERDSRFVVDENKYGNSPGYGGRYTADGSRAQQGSVEYLKDLVTGKNQDPRILESLRRMKESGSNPEFFKKLEEGTVEVVYETVVLHPDGKVTVSQFDLGGKVRLQWDGVGDLKITTVSE